MAENVQKIISVELKASQAINGISQLNELIRVEKDLMKQLTAENKKGSEQYATAERMVQEYNRAKRQLQREIQAEVKLEREQTGSLTQLRNQLSDLTKQYDNLSRAERNNVNVGGKLQKQINQVTNEIKLAEEGTQRYYRNVGNYQNAILGAMGLNNKYIQSIMMFTSSSQGVSGVFSQMAMGVKAFGRALWSLMTNPAFLVLAGIVGAGMAFKWFYDYNVECERALRLTKEFTGVAGEELQWLRAQIQATATTYDKEYKPVLESVDSIMSHFGVSAQEAMQVINDGFAAGADINGNFLDLIKQYAPTFADAGIKAEQFVAILTQTRSGVFSQQGLDAIRMGAARIREMGNTTAQALQKIGINSEDMLKRMREGTLDEFGALQEVAGKLKELSRNSQEYGEVMSAVFGRQGRFASQEMIEGLADIETNLDIVKEKTGEWGKAMDENRQANADFELELSSFFNVGENGWELMKKQVDTYVKVQLTNFIKKLKEGIIWLQNMYKTHTWFRVLLKLIANIGYVAANSGKIAFNSFYQGFKALGAWIDAMVNTFKSAFNAIKKMAQGVGDILAGNIEKGISEISNGWQTGIKNTLKGIKKALSESGRQLGLHVADLTAGGELLDATLPNISFGSGSTNFFGSGGDNEDKTVQELRELLEELLGKKKPSGGNGGGGNSGSSGSSSKNTDAEAEKRRLEQLNKQLLQAAIDMELRAKRELAKVSEQGIKEYYEAQRENLEKKYKDLGKAIYDETTAEGKAFTKLINDLNKQEEQALKDFQHNQEQTLLQKELDATGEGTDARFKKQRDLLDFNFKYEQEKYKENAEMLLAIQEKYNKDVAELEAKQAKERLDNQRNIAQARLEAMGDEAKNLQARLDLELELLEIQMQQELEQYENNEEMKTAIKAKYLDKQTALEEEYAKKEMEIQTAKYQAIADVSGGLSQIMEQFGEKSREAAIASKVLALGEIMISQAVAIANAVKAGSNAVNPWQMIAQIASSVTAVTVAMIQAFKSLDQAKFATGGYIQGAGTSTSDSIPVRVSNGESIMNANTTAMFGGLLSSLNQLGGGVPIQVAQTAQSVQGEDMLARAVARGVAMLPNPVVSVQDINQGQRQVEVMNERATL